MLFAALGSGRASRSGISARAHRLVRVGVLLLELSREHVERRLRLRQRDAGLQPRRSRAARGCPAARSVSLYSARGRAWRTACTRRTRPARRRRRSFGDDPGDRERLAVDEHRAADHRRVAVEPPLPVRSSEHDHWIRAERRPFRRQNQAAEPRRHAEHGEEIPGDVPGGDAVGAVVGAEPREGDGVGGQVREHSRRGPGSPRSRATTPGAAAGCPGA